MVEGAEEVEHGRAAGDRREGEAGARPGRDHDRGGSFAGHRLEIHRATAPDIDPQRLEPAGKVRHERHVVGRDARRVANLATEGVLPLVQGHEVALDRKPLRRLHPRQPAADDQHAARGG